MSRTSIRLVAATATSLLAICSATVAQAQETVATDEGETIVVTGLRGSLDSSRNIKRDASGIVDAIAAQDVGKLPDANLAESLQRITGVSIDRSGGEGAFVTVRGFGPEFNTVLVNGRQIATPTDPSQAGGRAFSFDTLASELIAGVKVHKSSTATLQSGGVGATMNIRTARPFDYNEMKFAASLGANYEENSKKLSPDGSFLYSNTFADGTLAWAALLGGALFAAFMILIAPRLFTRLAAIHQRRGLDMGLLGTVLVLFLISAFLMDSAGIHAVFGGFLLGTAMPRGRFADDLRERLEPFTTVFLLPMFFTFSGLNTQLQLVNSVDLLAAALAILAASFLAKGGACYAAARLFGHDHATGLSVAALMNARGLMELIIISIGLQSGISGPGMFAILVVMAIVTTLAATPMFELVRKRAA